MDRQCTAPVADRFGEETKVSARSTGARVFGLIALFGAFCWFIAFAPALASLALAVVAAIAWSVWLDRQRDVPRAADGQGHDPLTAAMPAVSSAHVPGDVAGGHSRGGRGNPPRG
jgi:hypothetical protein